MLTAILCVLSCGFYNEKLVVPDHKAAKPGKQWSLSYTDEKDAFSATTASSFCQNNATKMHLKHNFPCTSTWARSQNMVPLVFCSAATEKANHGSCIFFFPIELLENGGSVPGRQVFGKIKLVLPKLPGTLSGHWKQPDLTLNQSLKVKKISAGRSTIGRMTMWTW